MPLQSIAIAAPLDAAGIPTARRPVPSPDIVWTSVPFLQNLAEGVPVSDDAALRVTGPGAGSATYSLQYIAGTDATTLGATMTGSTLDVTAANAGTGTYRYLADVGGVVYPSPDFPITVTAQSTDALEPTPPGWRNWTPASSSQVDLELIPGMDPVDPTNTASGIADILLERREVGGAFAQIDTIAVSAPGESPAVQAGTVGTIPAGSSLAQAANGRDYTVIAASGGTAGKGFVDSIDGLYLPHVSVSGDFWAKITVPSFNGILTKFSAQHLMARESLAPGAKAVTATYRTDDDTGLPDRCQMKSRSQTDGNVVGNFFLQNMTGTVELVMHRAGDTWTLYARKLGDQWSELGSVVIQMAATVMLAFPAAPRSGDAQTITTTVQDFTVTTTPLIAYSDLASLEAGKAYEYRARSRDVDGNVGPYSPIVSLVLPGSGGGVVYNDVTESLPVLSNPTVYNTLASFPPRQWKDGSTTGQGLEQGPGWVYEFNGGGGDLEIDLRGDTGNPVPYPIYVTNTRRFNGIGIETILEQQATTAPGLLDNRNDSGGTKNWYYRAVGGRIWYIDVRESWALDGCILDANGHECDYLVPRNTQGVLANRDSIRYLYRNCMLLGNEGSSVSQHADIYQNQSNWPGADPITHPKQLTFEGCDIESGQNGFVIHQKGSLQQLILKLRRSNFKVVNTNQSPSAPEDVGPPVGSARGSIEQIIAEELYYGRYTTATGALRVTQGLTTDKNPAETLAEPGLGPGQPGFNYRRVGVDAFPVWVERQHLGAAYNLPTAA